MVPTFVDGFIRRDIKTVTAKSRMVISNGNRQFGGLSLPLLHGSDGGDVAVETLHHADGLRAFGLDQPMPNLVGSPALTTRRCREESRSERLRERHEKRLTKRNAAGIVCDGGLWRPDVNVA